MPDSNASPNPGIAAPRSEAELTQSLAGAGFAVERVYGDWDRRPSGPTTRELTVVAAS